jgi:predicted NAD-dependent protein-ADP-ribosyltransferase YbiA (DUF1768 family)
MRVLLRENLIVLIAESADEKCELDGWRAAHETHVFCADSLDPQALKLHGLGKRADACREPVNVVSNAADPVARMIGNFATAPFELDGRHYQSVESFWQDLKFSRDSERRHIAQLDGARARAEGEKQGYGPTISYGGQDIAVGTWPHWRLMERACRAKFTQNPQAAEALLATGERPLTHVVRRDSTTIPGVIMAAIWMRIRKDLTNGAPPSRADAK